VVMSSVVSDVSLYYTVKLNHEKSKNKFMKSSGHSVG